MPQQKISFPDEVWTIIQSYAKASGLSEAEIIRTLTLLGLPHYAPSVSVLRQEHSVLSQEKEDNLSATLVKLLAGVDVPEPELSIAGYHVGLTLDDMLRLKDCLLKSGGKKDAAIHH